MPNSQEEKTLIPELSEINENEKWKIEVRGDKGANPELRIPQPEFFYGRSAPLNFYPIETFRVTNKKSGKILDVLAATQDNWKHKLVIEADEEDARTAQSVRHYINYDEAHRESLWGRGFSSLDHPYDGFNRLPRNILFNLLYTSALENVGSPLTHEAAHLIRDKVNEQTDAMMTVWDDPADKRPMSELVKNAYSPPTTT